MVYVRRRVNIRKPRRASARRGSTRSSSRYGSRRPARRVKRGPRTPAELTPAAKFALAQLDPFEPKCLGAKIPDSNTMPSLANCDTDQVNIVPPGFAGDLVAWAFRPSYIEAAFRANSGTTSVTWANAANSRRNFTNVAASVEAIRPVAHAIRMSSSLPPTTAAGFVHVGISVESRRAPVASTNPDWPTTVNQMTGLAYYKRFTLASLTQSPVTCINKWLDDSGFRYDDPNAIAGLIGTGTILPTNTLNFWDSWGTLIVMVEGHNSTVTSPLSVEHILLTECIPRKDAFVLGSQAAPHSAGTLSATSVMAGETDFAHTEAQQDTYIQQGLEAFQRGAALAGERVYNDVAVPLLGRFGSAVINTGMAMAINAVTGRGGLMGINANPSRLAIG